ncbi:hypothetical protein [uncultured Megasphaera sp.]|nr:hypothetical protein [uncultured Megasphaera sp.]
MEHAIDGLEQRVCARKAGKYFRVLGKIIISQEKINQEKSE